MNLKRHGMYQSLYSILIWNLEMLISIWCLLLSSITQFVKSKALLILFRIVFGSIGFSPHFTESGFTGREVMIVHPVFCLKLMKHDAFVLLQIVKEKPMHKEASGFIYHTCWNIITCYDIFLVTILNLEHISCLWMWTVASIFMPLICLLRKRNSLQ